MGSHADGWQQPLFFPFSSLLPPRHDTGRGEARRSRAGLESCSELLAASQKLKRVSSGLPHPFLRSCNPCVPTPAKPLKDFNPIVMCTHTHSVTILLYSTLLVVSMFENRKKRVGNPGGPSRLGVGSSGEGGKRTLWRNNTNEMECDWQVVVVVVVVVCCWETKQLCHFIKRIPSSFNNRSAANCDCDDADMIIIRPEEKN